MLTCLFLSDRDLLINYMKSIIGKMTGIYTQFAGISLSISLFLRIRKRLPTALKRYNLYLFIGRMSTEAVPNPDPALRCPAFPQQKGKRYMGRRSTRENKNIYQLLREEQELTRREASDRMTGISPARLEKFEYETQIPEPYDVVQMAEAYHRPDLCNYYCSHECAIGHKYVPEVALSDLPDIILETIAGLNALTPLTGRLIQIARDGKITDDEIHDFAAISAKLDEISLAIDTLNLWVDKTAGENQLNLELLNEEKKKLRGR